MKITDGSDSTNCRCESLVFMISERLYPAVVRSMSFPLRTWGCGAWNSRSSRWLGRGAAHGWAAPRPGGLRRYRFWRRSPFESILDEVYLTNRRDVDPASAHKGTADAPPTRTRHSPNGRRPCHDPPLSATLQANGTLRAGSAQRPFMFDGWTLTAAAIGTLVAIPVFSVLCHRARTLRRHLEPISSPRCCGCTPATRSG